MGHAGVAFTDVGVLAGTSLPNVSEYDDQQLYPGTGNSSLNGKRITNTIAPAMNHGSSFDQLGGRETTLTRRRTGSNSFWI